MTQGQCGRELAEDRDIGAGFQQDRDASTGIGLQELTCQLEQMLAGPHICRLRTHIDGHIAHDVDPICICVCLQIAVVMTEMCRSPPRQDLAQDPAICRSATEWARRYARMLQMPALTALHCLSKMYCSATNSSMASLCSSRAAATALASLRILYARSSDALWPVHQVHLASSYTGAFTKV